MRVYEVLECGSDNFLVTAKITIPYNTQTTRNTEHKSEEPMIKQIKYNIEGL